MVLSLVIWLLSFLTLDPISLSVYPTISFAPADLRVTISTPRNNDNISTCLTYDSDIGDAGSSCWEMLGDREPVTKQIWLKGLHRGEYVIRVDLQRHSGKVYSQSRSATIN